MIILMLVNFFSKMVKSSDIYYLHRLNDIINIWF